jgi:hypothetical protein
MRVLAWELLANAVDPGGEPAPQISPTRDGREVVELAQHAVAGEPLDEPQAEGGAADPAARKAQGGASDAVLVQPGVEALDPLGVELPLVLLRIVLSEVFELFREVRAPRLERLLEVLPGEWRLDALALVFVGQDSVQQDGRAGHRLPPVVFRRAAWRLVFLEKLRSS